MIPGEYVLGDDAITCNVDKKTRIINVVNRGDRPIQVGSHYHFAEANPHLEFDRLASRGMRLDSPAGTAVRFEPGDARGVHLVEIGGERMIFGLRDEINGFVGSKDKELTVNSEQVETGSPVKNSNATDEGFDANEEVQTNSTISGSKAASSREIEKNKEDRS